MDNLYFKTAEQLTEQISETEGQIATFRGIYRKTKGNAVREEVIDIINELTKEVKELECSRRFYSNTGRKHLRSLRQSMNTEALNSQPA